MATLRMGRALVVLGMLLASSGCHRRGTQSMTPTSTAQARVVAAPFGSLPSGEAVTLYTLTNASGLEIRAMTYGGIILSIRTPDRAHSLGDIVLGYDSLAGYMRATPYFGAIVGRYANRIARGKFTLDGKTYTLAVNNGPNALHGGLRGFDKVVWEAKPFQRDGAAGVELTHTSQDGDEGYPGTLTAHVTYTLTNRNELIVDYVARADRATPVNLSQHSYFNLAGDGARDILAHELTIDADGYTPVDSTLIPTGEIAPVAGTPFDFRAPTAIGARINEPNAQLKIAGGYDHNFVLNGKSGELRRVIRVHDPASGRTMDISTTQPGVQFYSGNFLDGSITGKNGHVYRRNAGFAMETQHFPDSPNHPNFPSTILRPGSEFRSRTVFAFSVTP
jgi:aldose 1-epimerase